MIGGEPTRKGTRPCPAERFLRKRSFNDTAISTTPAVPAVSALPALPRLPSIPGLSVLRWLTSSGYHDAADDWNYLPAYLWRFKHPSGHHQRDHWHLWPIVIQSSVPKKCTESQEWP